jgi:hypothetical protein
MRRVAAAIAVGAVAVAAAAPAQGYEGPCSKQRELFEKYNIQFDMNAPPVSYAYGETCSRTG